VKTGQALVNEPDFSIIIPTYERPRLLADCLQALGRLDYPRDRFEVLVVNDGGETRLDTVVAMSQRQYDVTLLTQPRRGPAAARNTGAAHARGRFLAFTDDDCEPTPSWLANLAACFAETSGCLVGGRVLNAVPRNNYSAASQLLIDYFYSCQTGQLVKAPFFTSNNMALPAAGFRTLAGFDSRFPLPAAEDRDLCDRWRHAHRPMVYAPQAVVHHKHILTFHTFWRQQVRYGRGAARFHHLRARRTSGRVRLESSAFYLNLFWYPRSRARASRVIPLILLVTLAQGAVAYGYLSERRKVLARSSS
jgi:glycosyltransferase involved in cell wall biosynthesis